MAKCEMCGNDLKSETQRFCSEACRGIFMEKARHGTRRSPGRTTAKRRRRRGR
jgi:predicted nucleic acid-binding Zn ribbon protein